MAIRYEKDTGDIVWTGAETGIAPSPHKGTAHMQSVNISTESGEVMASFSRVQNNQPGDTSTVHTLTRIDSSHLTTSFNLTNGQWITVSSSTISGLSNGAYYVQNSNGAVDGTAASTFQLNTIFTNSGSPAGGFGAGTANFVLTKVLGQPVAYAIETYTGTGQQFRYYVLDSQGLVWVYDTGAVNLPITGTIGWFLPSTDVSYFSGGTVPSGIAVLNGWVMVFSGATIFCVPTVDLGKRFTQFTNAAMSSFPSGTTPHFAYTGHQGKTYYCDGNYIGEIFPDTSLLVTTLPNIQSYAKYTASSTTGTIATLITGSMPNNGLPTGSGGLRVPAVFFTDASGTIPSAITAGTIYYIQNNNGALTFQVFAAATGGSAIDISTGAVGNQYYNTFYPISAGGQATITYTPQRVNLPEFEVAQCMTEIGNNIIIGGIGNVLYPWNQIDALPSGLIFLPESHTYSMTTVNQMAYIFAGNKGNVYITDGSVASLVIKIPDYCAGIAGTSASYIEPYFTWGGSAYIRGRVYCSILDQTSTKVGNCGGIWSFVPTQNLYIGQDTGLALRLENQNSYGTYNGVATIIIPSQTQLAIAPQYWSGWYSSISSPTYGIDFTNTTPSTSGLIETDVIATGTILGKQKVTFNNLEYKLAAPLASGETIGLKYRLNATDSYTSMTINTESATGISGYVSPLPFANTQWVQFQISLNPIASTSSSFCRLTELRLRTE